MRIFQFSSYLICQNRLQPSLPLSGWQLVLLLILGLFGTWKLSPELRKLSCLFGKGKYINNVENLDKSISFLLSRCVLLFSVSRPFWVYQILLEFILVLFALFFMSIKKRWTSTFQRGDARRTKTKLPVIKTFIVLFFKEFSNIRLVCFTVEKSLWIYLMNHLIHNTGRMTMIRGYRIPACDIQCRYSVSTFNKPSMCTHTSCSVVEASLQSPLSPHSLVTIKREKFRLGSVKRSLIISKRWMKNVMNPSCESFHD